MLIQIAKLTAGTALVWLLVAWPVWHLAGAAGVRAVSFAAVVCLLPGWLVFALHSLYGTRAVAVAFVAVGTLLRMPAALAAVVAVRVLRPDADIKAFLCGLTLFYLTTLGLETRLLLAISRPQSDGSPSR